MLSAIEFRFRTHGQVELVLYFYLNILINIINILKIFKIPIYLIIKIFIFEIMH